MWRSSNRTVQSTSKFYEWAKKDSDCGMVQKEKLCSQLIQFYVPHPTPSGSACTSLQGPLLHPLQLQCLRLEAMWILLTKQGQARGKYGSDSPKEKLGCSEGTPFGVRVFSVMSFQCQKALWLLGSWCCCVFCNSKVGRSRFPFCKQYASNWLLWQWGEDSPERQLFLGIIWMSS